MKRNPTSQSAFLNPRVLLGFALCAVGIFAAALAFAQAPKGGKVASADKSASVQFGTSSHHDESPALRDMPRLPVRQTPEREGNENPKLPHFHIDRPDPVIQKSFGVLRGSANPSMPSPILTFDGIVFPGVACSCAPPDPNGEVGLTQYVQMVNEGLQVFNKATGASTFGPVGISTLWQGFGGVCENNGSGDPIVMYDQLADRWIISQFAGASVPTDECIAVSKTGDATGAYYRYDFNLGTNFFDYPHLGVWPDGYYMSMNVFNSGGTAFLGPQAFAFDRAKMLIGAAATFVTPGITGGATEDSFLPADLDGYSLPPANAPNSFVETPFTGAYKTWHFHADFVTPANTTFTLFASPTSAAFSELCSATRACVPQLGSADGLDGIGDRLMYRLAYRNIGGVESLVGNHTVLAGGVAAPRWFELRGVTAGPVTVFQESTYQPDTTWRWMGSAAMDNQGNLAIGFSASDATISPQIRYAGRLATDPVNNLAQGESTLFAGTGSQTGTGNRWGDYSDMTVDPSDDCTFWYTQEYYSTTGTFGWRTRVGNFKFPVCTQSARGAISGTITNCQSGLPIAGAQVTINGGYSRSTDASGNYSAIVAPGTYNATATAPGASTATSGTLVVSNGGTATFSACLTGTPTLVADTAPITADSCNSNGVIDPNEMVTVNFGIKNTGLGNTTNLVATLQATGGVTSPSGPQNYGVILAGGATVSRSFTFTAGNLSCGAALIATLQLQDGATNLGTITYNFTTGQVVTSMYTTGNIAVAIPDNVPAGVDIPLTVADVMTITDVNVSFRLNHTFDGDLIVSLVHPDGTVVILSNRRGSSGANFGTGTNDCSGAGTMIDDQATTLISAGVAPFSGSFQPESPLSALNGKPSNGTWILRVSDNAAIDTGTVGCFKLELNRTIACCGALITAVPPATIAAENFSPPNMAADPGELVTVNLPLHNVGASNTTNLVGTLQATGGVTSPSGPQSYGVVTGLGPTVSRTFSFIASGTCGNTITLSLSLQDGANSLGTVTYTLPLGTTTASAPQTFSNATSVTIPASGTGATTGAPATPYPSNITVSGLTGTISKVTVALNGLNHTFPSDVDMLLVGPGGQSFIILSDVIGGTDWVGINYVLDDAAAGVVPSSGTPVSGTFRPTNYGTGDVFPAPAPASGYNNPATAGTATFASVYNGTNPNGTWSLYIVDDASADVGTMSGGWSITITTAAPVCVSNQAPLIVNGPPPSPVIVGTPYSFSFAASGNPAPTYSLIGTLPPGLMFSSAGVLSGTCTSGGTGSFPGITVTATNAVAPDAMQSFALNTATRANNYIASFGLVGPGAALTADPDRDGLNNLLEYGLGLNPTMNSLSGLPVVTLKNYSGTSFLSMLFHRSSLATDLTYIVQVSGDLVNWTNVGTSAAGGITSGTGFVIETGSAPNFTVEVKDTVPYNPMAPNKRFMRLMITSP